MGGQLAGACWAHRFLLHLSHQGPSEQLTVLTYQCLLQKGQHTKLVPAEPGLLAEAARWVDSWQEPVGHTNYDAALQLAEQYLGSDCAYIFSDGLSDYAIVLLEVSAVLPVWKRIT